MPVPAGCFQKHSGTPRAPTPISRPEIRATDSQVSDIGQRHPRRARGCAECLIVSRPAQHCRSRSCPCNPRSTQLEEVGDQMPVTHRPGTGRAADDAEQVFTRRAVTVTLALVACFTFAFSFTNVWALGIQLGVPRLVGPLVSAIRTAAPSGVQPVSRGRGCISRCSPGVLTWRAALPRLAAPAGLG